MPAEVSGSAVSAADAEAVAGSVDEVREEMGVVPVADGSASASSGGAVGVADVAVFVMHCSSLL